jgi:phage terminase small subunit
MVARFNLCERMIKEQGEILTTTTPKGIVRTYPNPYIKMGMDSLRSANELARQYGLNPLSRDRLNIESQKTENTNDSYFN